MVASAVVFAVLELLPGNAAEVILGDTATPEAVAALEGKLDRNNRWHLSVHEGQLTIVTGGEAIEAVLEAVPLLPASS